jgi:hypothetical protein
MRTDDLSLPVIKQIVFADLEERFGCAEYYEIAWVTQQLKQRFRWWGDFFDSAEEILDAERREKEQLNESRKARRQNGGKAVQSVETTATA